MSDPARDPFERIYRRHVADVYRFALAVLRNPAEAEDVTQTTFLNAYRAFERGDRPARVNSWLIAIAHNAIRSRHRWSLRRPKEVPLEEAIHSLALPAEDQATVREVLEVLGTLPETQRTALAMRELEGRSYPEIAETMGVSIPAVESLIARARRTLRSKHQSLRGLTVVQLPRSLRSFFEQGDVAGTSLAMKAAVVAVAAGALAGGAAITSKNAGASKTPTRAARPEPSRALVATARRGPRVSDAVLVEAPAAPRAATTRPSAPPTPGSTAPAPVVAPAPAPAPRAGPTGGRGAMTPVDGPTTDPGGTAAPPGPPGQEETTSSVTTPAATVTYRQPTPPTVPTLPTAPALPSPPSSLDPSTWQAPAPPQLPQAPQAPTPPSAPQVSLPGGIK